MKRLSCDNRQSCDLLIGDLRYEAFSTRLWLPVCCRRREFFPLGYSDRCRRLLKESSRSFTAEPARNGGSITLVCEFQGFFTAFLRASF